MLCPKCQFEQNEANLECVRCGIVFEKYKSREKDMQEAPSKVSDESMEITYEGSIIKRLLFHVEPVINPFFFGGRVLLFLIILIWGWKFILSPLESNSVGNSLWHLVNLPFHEVGHIIFRPFGQFMTSLGGSLGQLFMPLTCLVVLLVATRDVFGASVSLWWLGENFMDLAPYINDARALQLPLLGGNTGRTAPYGFHDWEFILKESGLIRYDHILAHTAYAIGIILILVSFVWGGYILFKQFRNLDI